MRSRRICGNAWAGTAHRHGLSGWESDRGLLRRTCLWLSFGHARFTSISHAYRTAVLPEIFEIDPGSRAVD